MLIGACSYDSSSRNLKMISDTGTVIFDHMYKCSDNSTMIGITDKIIANGGSNSYNHIKLWDTSVEVFEEKVLGENNLTYTEVGTLKEKANL